MFKQNALFIRRILIASALASVVVVSLPLQGSANRGGAGEATGPASPNEVESRIKSLHTSLAITPAQEPAWDAFARLMRGNAKAMADRRKTASLDRESRSAVDDMKAYAEMIDAHAQEVHEILPTFQALYDSLSTSQKKTADVVFRRHPHGPKAKVGG